MIKLLPIHGCFNFLEKQLPLHEDPYCLHINFFTKVLRSKGIHEKYVTFLCATTFSATIFPYIFWLLFKQYNINVSKYPQNKQKNAQRFKY